MSKAKLGGKLDSMGRRVQTNAAINSHSSQNGNSIVKKTYDYEDYDIDKIAQELNIND